MIGKEAHRGLTTASPFFNLEILHANFSHSKLVRICHMAFLSFKGIELFLPSSWPEKKKRGPTIYYSTLKLATG